MPLLYGVCLFVCLFFLFCFFGGGGSHLYPILTTSNPILGRIFSMKVPSHLPQKNSFYGELGYFTLIQVAIPCS